MEIYLRTVGSAHPQASELADALYEYLKQN